VVPVQQFPDAPWINLCQAGEIENDMLTTHFLGSQDSSLDAYSGVMSKMASKGEDFRAVMLLFTNLKHGGTSGL
jgi:hypothetical protein